MNELPHGLFWRGKKIWMRFTDPGTNKQTFKSTGTGDIEAAKEQLIELKQQIDVLRSCAGRKRKRKPKDEIGIYLRGNIYWCRWTDASGKSHEISSGSDQIVIAKALLERKKLAASAHKYPELKALLPPEQTDITKFTFQEFFEKSYKPSYDHQAAFADKEYLINKFIAEYGNVLVKDINASIFIYFRNNVLKKRGIGTATRNRYRTVLLHVMSEAKDLLLITNAELATLVDGFKKEAESSAAFLPLTEGELTKLIKEVAKQPHLHEVVVFGTYTGWRSGSIKKLTWDNVDEERGQVSHPPKNPNAPWVHTPITGPVQWVLERRKLSKDDRIPYVFFNPITETAWSDMRQSWGTAKRNAGISHKRVGFHSLRGTFARQLEDGGLPISEIQKLLGHTSLATTQRYLERLASTRDTKKDIEKLFPDLRYDGTPEPPEEAWKIEHAEWEATRDHSIWSPGDFDDDPVEEFDFDF